MENTKSGTEEVKPKKEFSSSINKSFTYEVGEVKLTFSLAKEHEADFLQCLKKSVEDVEKSINEK